MKLKQNKQRQSNRRAKYRLFAAMLAASLTLTGCGSALQEYLEPVITETKESFEYLLGLSDTETLPEIPAVQETPTASQEQDTAPQETGAIAEETNPETTTAVEEQSSVWEPIPDTAGSEYRYAYRLLDDRQQVIYGEILHAVRNFAEVPVSTLDKDEVDYIYNCVLCDHPELFYTDGYTVTAHSVGGVLQTLSVKGNYTFTQEEISAAEREINTYVMNCLAGAPEGSSYEKVKYIYEYIIDHTTYDLHAPNNQNIVSVMVNGSSVCNGYAKSMQYLLLEQGIPATFVTGTTRGEGHAWVLVNIDGEYSYVDPTWGDAQFTGSDEGAVWINYDYLCMTTEDLLKNHTISDMIEMPDCTSMTYNYYVQEGLYLDSYDTEKLQQIIGGVYDRGERIIRFRCATNEVYQAMWNDLIAERNIYQYLRGETRISYTQSEELHTITIIL